MYTTHPINELQHALKDPELTKAEHIRVHAVLLRKKGYSVKQIVDITEQSHSAIEKWLAGYNRAGLSSLYAKRSPGQSRAKLTHEQKEQLKQSLTGHKPTDYGVSGDFWSVPTIKQLLNDRYGVTYRSLQSYRTLLTFCGFSYQKVEYVDAKKQSVKAAHFKKRFEKRLKRGTISMWW